ncbi:MAG: hypothetical protein ACEPO2_22365 [Pelagibaca sp.]
MKDMTISEVAILLASRIALSAGYSEADIQAGTEFYRRKNRLSHPPGAFDKAGRFVAAERSSRVVAARRPSRAYPYSEMAAARTAAHCAEIYCADSLHAKRIDRAIAVLIETDLIDSAHATLKASRLVAKILKPVKAAG